MNAATNAVLPSIREPLFKKLELDHFRVLLEEQQAEQLEIQSEASRILGDRGSRMEGDEMERGDRDEQNKAAITMDRTVHALGKIARAMVRIQKGTYGTCMESPCRGNGVIERSRLEAMPHAEWCTQCASVKERW